jgi:Ni,Fe-hydrogenase III small subunit
VYVLLKQLYDARRSTEIGRGRRTGSLALRHVDAGSCNGCEHELQATANPLYDMSRFGIAIVASPRHADLLLVTGPITTRMAAPLRYAYAAMPEPRLVAALGDCALGNCHIGSSWLQGSLGGEPGEVLGSLEKILPVDLVIRGCPPTPEAIVAGLQLLAAGRGRLPTPRRDSSGSRAGPPIATGE